MGARWAKREGYSLFIPPDPRRKFFSSRAPVWLERLARPEPDSVTARMSWVFHGRQCIARYKSVVLSAELRFRPRARCGAGVERDIRKSELSGQGRSGKGVLKR